MKRTRCAAMMSPSTGRWAPTARRCCPIARVCSPIATRARSRPPGHGTALGVIRSAVEAGKPIEVYADETRPFLQGARLTAWELQQDGIPVTLIADSAAGFLMSRGDIDAVIVGADRVAANGDVANKIGTYPLAVLARQARHTVLCRVPAVDDRRDGRDGRRHSDRRALSRGSDWVTAATAGRRKASRCLNPVFDVTPAELVTALITEKGVMREPDGDKIAALMKRQ